MNLSNILRIILAAVLTLGISAHTKRTPEEMVKYRELVTRNAQLLNACLENPELKKLSTRIQAKRQESLHHIRKARSIELAPRGKPPITPNTHTYTYIHTYIHSTPSLTFPRPPLLRQMELPLPRPHQRRQRPLPHQRRIPLRLQKRLPPSSCILTPEVTLGPFFADHEALRQDIRAGQPGIYQRLALQVIDIATCKPLEGARVDIWQTNATGWYAKDVRDSHGDGAAHWLTGAQRTTDWGVVDFDTVFPGHYAGRCVHTHVAVRPGEKFNDGEGFVHAGQIFYDDKVREGVGGYAPYTENGNKVVVNKDDYYGPGVATKEYDPLAQWAWLDDGDHEAGLVSWITIGINTSYHRDWW